MKLSGIPIALQVKNKLQTREKPSGKLAIIQVGSDPVSSLYVKKKLEFAKELNIDAVAISLEPQEAQSRIMAIANDPEVKGIIIQLPLPDALNNEQILRLVPKEKDVDGFRYIMDEEFSTYPPTILAIKEILDFYNIPLDRGVLIVGAGFLVGKPLYKFLKEKNIQTEVLDKDSENYEARLKAAKVVVVATGGGRSFVDQDFAQGAYVIDASTVAEEQKIRGDVDPNTATINLAGVPGGVGPITVAKLFENFFDL